LPQISVEIPKYQISPKYVYIQAEYIWTDNKWTSFVMKYAYKLTLIIKN